MHIKIKSINNTYATADFSLAGVETTTQVQEIKDVVYLDLNSQAPDWKLPSNKIKPISLKELRGKVVMLDFWGTWCAPCLKSMPAVQAIYDHFKDQPVEVIGVSVEMENAIDVPAYIKMKGYTYPIAFDGKLIARRGFPFCEQVPLWHPYYHNASSSAANTPENLVHQYSLIP